MDYNIGAAIGAGLVATAVMTAILYMGIAMMPKQMTMNLLYMLGTMMKTPGSAVIYASGAVIHVMMGVVFALIHTGLYVAFDLTEGLVLWGLLFGFLHWVIFGIGLGMMRPMHQGIRNGTVQDPGMFAMNLPAMTVMGALMLHLVFGVTVGGLYEAWA